MIDIEQQWCINQSFYQSSLAETMPRKKGDYLKKPGELKTKRVLHPGLYGGNKRTTLWHKARDGLLREPIVVRAIDELPVGYTFRVMRNETGVILVCTHKVPRETEQMRKRREAAAKFIQFRCVHARSISNCSVWLFDIERFDIELFDIERFDSSPHQCLTHHLPHI